MEMRGKASREGLFMGKVEGQSWPKSEALCPERKPSFRRSTLTRGFGLGSVVLCLHRDLLAYQRVNRRNFVISFQKKNK